MIVYDFNPNNLPSEVLQAIGLATTAAAQAESVVEMLIGSCLGIDSEYAAAITTHMTAPLRDHVARAVAEIRIEDTAALNELDRLLDKMGEAQNKRNGLVHNTWARHPDTGDLYRIKTTARGTVDVSVDKWTVEMIRDDANFIYETGMELLTFMVARGLDMKPPPLRPRGHKTKKARKARRKAP